MKKPVIIVDIDNVLAQSAKGFVAFSNKTFGTTLTPDDYQEDFKNMWGVSQEEAERRALVIARSEVQSEYEPMSYAKKVLNNLKLNYQLIALTSRRKLVSELTKNWLERYYQDLFDEVIFAGFWDNFETKDAHLLTKGELYKSLGATYVIDDQPKHCESAAENGVKALLFGHYGWNDTTKVQQEIVRVKDWNEVKEFFDGQKRN